jgi:hypothetical protein
VRSSTESFRFFEVLGQLVLDSLTLWRNQLENA